MKDLKDLFIGMNVNQKVETKNLDNNNVTRYPLEVSFQEVNRLFVLAFSNTDGDTNQVETNSHRKYFPPKLNITDYNVLIDYRNIYDQVVSDLIKRYDEIRKTATGKGDDYTTGCLLD